MRVYGGGFFIRSMTQWLEAWGYREVEVPSLTPVAMFETCTNGTENRMFRLGNLVLMPEVTNFIRWLGKQRLGTPKVFYVARCFRDERTTDSERLREFTQVGVEFLGDNPLNCRKVVRRDAIRLLEEVLPVDAWRLFDGVERGLNLYTDTRGTFEVLSTANRKQLLGGGCYEEGAGWALGLERLMVAQNA